MIAMPCGGQPCEPDRRGGKALVVAGVLDAGRVARGQCLDNPSMAATADNWSMTTGGAVASVASVASVVSVVLVALCGVAWCCYCCSC